MGIVPLGSIPDVVTRGQCMGCGLCQLPLDAAEADSPIRMEWSEEHEHWVPRLPDAAPTDDQRVVCPGAVMDMPSLADAVFGHQPVDPMAGDCLWVASGHASDAAVRSAAASGGITSALLGHLFEIGAIDVAYCATGQDPHGGRGALIRSVEELGPTRGSHYHPVHFGAALPELLSGAERFAFVGLPCEIAGMREIMAQRPDVAPRCIAMIGLFCGGINRYSGIGRYLERFGVTPASVTRIDYRDGPWPGRIRLEGENGEVRTIPRIHGNSRWNILHYVISFQGWWMLPRCRICPDQVADFADIAVGDPHLPRFRGENSPGHSAIIARTARGVALLRAAEAAGAISLDELSRDELVKSQGYTLENRRQAELYARVAAKLGFVPPVIRGYAGLEALRTWHQWVYAYVDLLKIRWRKVRWLRPLYLPLQVFEYLFLTFSVRVLIARIGKLLGSR